MHFFPLHLLTAQRVASDHHAYSTSVMLVPPASLPLLHDACILESGPCYQLPI